MKSVFIILTFKLLPLILNSQTTYLVEYEKKFNNLYDEGGISVIKSSGVLLTSDKLSYYYERASVDNEKIEDSGWISYKNFGTNKLLFKSSLGKKQNYFDTLHNYKWEITDDIKYIDSFKCMKSEMSSRGRTYIAWFTTDIPIFNGPWKLGGLPGLVVEVYDKNNDLHYLLKKITRTDKVIPFLEGQFIPALEFRKKFAAALKAMKEGAITEKSTGNCVDCTGDLTVSIKTWENIED